MSTSVDSAGNATQQNDLIVDQLLSLSSITAKLLSQNLSPWQTAAVQESVSAVLSAVGGESKNKPVDLATSPKSSDQDKSSCCCASLCRLAFHCEEALYETALFYLSILLLITFQGKLFKIPRVAFSPAAA